MASSLRRSVANVTVLTAVSGALLWANARPAVAHGLGQSYDLPLPTWLFLYGAGAAVLISFVPVALLVGGEGPTRGYPRFDLFRIGGIRAVLNNGAFLFFLRLLSVSLLLLVVLSGLLGRQDPGLNFAPTFVWITWWVGLGFFTAFVGNVWPLVNPWKILFEWADALARRLGVKGGLELGIPYPAYLGVWPAVALYAAFAWTELVFAGSDRPAYVAVLAVDYSIVAWGGMAVFGKDVWLRRGEAFSVFFELLGKFAPTEVRVKAKTRLHQAESDAGCVNDYERFAAALPEDRELDLRPPASGLGRAEPVPLGGVFFVVLVLAGVAFDGLLSTSVWARLESAVPASQTLGLLALPLLFSAVYLVFVWLSGLCGGGRLALTRLAEAYVYTLVPIAVAYQVAHYYTFLLVQGQAVFRHVSDPFGWGWNLLGTGGYTVKAGILEADSVWYSQVALIVAGHVVAVYLAHKVAVRLFRNQNRALLSQVPMLALMVLYTVFSLWVLSQDDATANTTPPRVPVTDTPEPAMPPPPPASETPRGP